MFAQMLYRVLQHRYYRAKVKAEKAVHKLNKANLRFADAANALNEYEAKIIEYGNTKSVISENPAN